MASFTVSLDDKVSKPAEKAAASTNKLAGALDNLKGVEKLQGQLAKPNAAALKGQIQETGMLDQKTQGLNGSLMAMAPYAAGAAIALERLKTVASVVGNAILDGAKLAVQLVEQRGALKSWLSTLANGDKAADAMIQGMGKLTEKLRGAFDKSQIEAWARQLLSAQVPANLVLGRVHAIAAATAIMGDSGGAAAQALFVQFSQLAKVRGPVVLTKELIAQLNQAGLSTGELAKMLGVSEKKLLGAKVTAQSMGDALQAALIKKGAGPLARLALGWDAISRAFSQGIAEAFSGLDDVVVPFMEALQSIVGELNAGSPAAKDFKGAVQSTFRALFTAGTTALTAIHVGLLTVYVWLLKLRIAARPLTNLIPKDAGVDALIIGLKGLAVIAGVVAVAMFIMLAPLMLLGALVIAAGFALYNLVSGLAAAAGALGEWASAAMLAGANVVKGIVQGIAGGAAWVVSAMANLARSGIAAFKSTLGIASPSKVMARFGVFTAQGVAQGLDAGAGDVADAAQGVGAAAITGTANGAAGAPAAGAGARSVTINVQAGAVVIHGGASASMQRLLEEGLAELLERLALQAGVGGEEAAAT